MRKKKSIKQTFISSSKEMFFILFIYFVLDFILRSYESYLLYPYYTDIKGLLDNEINGFYHDIFKLSTLLFIYFPLHLLLSFWFGKKALILSEVFLFVFVVLSFFTIQYYIVSFVPLDQSFYSYKLEDITNIILSSGDFSWISFIVFIFILFSYFFLLKIKFNSILPFTIIWLVWIITIPNISYSHVKAKFFESSQEFYLVKNKAIYFIEQSAKYYAANRETKERYSHAIITKTAHEYASIYPNNNFIIPTYPILRKRNDPDVLGQFLHLKDSMPNIVFIILESMGRNICGPNARFGSFTPFLDSLIKHSLYWENFLSNADRTFGAIPNILGSLPFGDKSFHEHKEKALPLHQTLISLLNKNNYRTSFYYGGWNHFNNMDDILNASNIDFILDKFDSSATKIKSDTKGFSWGYDDKSLFRQYLKIINSDSVKNTTRLDILLTLSLHQPFMPPNESNYLSQLKKIVGNLPKAKQESIKPYIKPLTTVLYVDDALRYLFKEYRKRKDFNNTIFIITGDHNIHAMPDNNELCQYNVPLIIYSPMLKSNKKFTCIGSHQDIYPSILALLDNKYKLKLPMVTHAISNGLCVSPYFEQNKVIPFFLGRNLNTSILDNGYYFTQDKCYKLSRGMNLKPEKNKDTCNKLKHNLEVIKRINKYVYNQNKILPEKYK